MVEADRQPSIHSIQVPLIYPAMHHRPAPWLMARSTVHNDPTIEPHGLVRTHYL
jgi:hypothetical protein